MLVNESQDQDDASQLDEGDQSLSSAGKGRQVNAYVDHRDSSKKQILFDGELTFGGESSVNQRSQKNSQSA